MKIQILAIVVPALFALIAGGCRSTGEGGEEGYSALGGTMTKVLEAPLPQAFAASMTGMRELGLKPMEREMDAFRASIIGETVMGQISQSHEIRVSLTRMTDKTTKIQLRIVGRRDEDRLKGILDEIEKRIGKPKS